MCKTTALTFAGGISVAIAAGHKLARSIIAFIVSTWLYFVGAAFPVLMHLEEDQVLIVAVVSHDLAEFEIQAILGM